MEFLDCIHKKNVETERSLWLQKFVNSYRRLYLTFNVLQFSFSPVERFWGQTSANNNLSLLYQIILLQQHSKQPYNTFIFIDMTLAHVADVFIRSLFAVGCMQREKVSQLVDQLRSKLQLLSALLFAFVRRNRKLYSGDSAWNNNRRTKGVRQSLSLTHCAIFLTKLQTNPLTKTT